MILSKSEWKIYKERNIKRLVLLHNSCKYYTKDFLYNIIMNNSSMYKFYNNFLEKYLKLRFRLIGKASFPNIDFQVTTRCTLNCRECCSLMPFFTNETHYDETFENFKKIWICY